MPSLSVDRFLDWLYPPKCGLCARIGEPPICAKCRSTFRPVGPNPLPTPGPEISAVESLFLYEGRAAQAVQRLKYERATPLADPLSAMLREFVDQKGLLGRTVVPVPISARRRRERGFNQAELLAAKLLSADGTTSQGILRRVRHTRPQVGLPRPVRLTNLSGAFAASGFHGQDVLLIDDVTTTGATGKACAEALIDAGATDVVLLTVCYDPPPDSEEKLTAPDTSVR